jgi:MFS family permease
MQFAPVGTTAGQRVQSPLGKEIMRLLATQNGLPRISWGAVIAGVILSLTVYLVMSVLGTAIGASLLSPMSSNATHGFGFGSGVWVIVTTVLAVFVGSYFSGRCAPVLGWLHGLLTWAVMTLFVIYAMASFVGSAVSAVGSAAATTASAGAAAANQATPSVVDSAKQQVQTAVASAASAISSPVAEQDARQGADTAARGLARASWYSFAALVVGAIIALVSGGAGFRHQPPFEDVSGSAKADDRPYAAANRQPRPTQRVP